MFWVILFLLLVLVLVSVYYGKGKNDPSGAYEDPVQPVGAYEVEDLEMV